MAQVHVTQRTYNATTGKHEYKKVGVFKTYKEAIEHFHGHQFWWDKQYHRFTANGDLYTMERITK